MHTQHCSPKNSNRENPQYTLTQTCKFNSLIRSFLAHSRASSSLVSTLVCDTYIPVSDIFFIRDLGTWPMTFTGSSEALLVSRSRLFILALCAAAAKSVSAPSVSSCVSPVQRANDNLKYIVWSKYLTEISF